MQTIATFGRIEEIEKRVILYSFGDSPDLSFGFVLLFLSHSLFRHILSFFPINFTTFLIKINI